MNGARRDDATAHEARQGRPSAQAHPEASEPAAPDVRGRADRAKGSRAEVAAHASSQKKTLFIREPLSVASLLFFLSGGGGALGWWWRGCGCSVRNGA